MEIENRGRTSAGVWLRLFGRRAGTLRVGIALLAVLLAPLSARAGVKLQPEAELLSHAAHGRFEDAARLLDAHAFDKYILGRALHQTLRWNPKKPARRFPFLQRLILDGAKLDYVDALGMSALVVAIKQLDEPLVERLILSGADPRRKDDNGKDAFAYAVLGQGKNGSLEGVLKRTPKPAIQPEVENITLQMKKGDVLITFDLIAAEAVSVHLEGSLDGGAHYGMIFDHATGDVGDEIPPGKGKMIVWNARGDYPEGLQNADIVLDVVARLPERLNLTGAKESKTP